MKLFPCTDKFGSFPPSSRFNSTDRMPRLRGSELPQRQSPRVPLQTRTSSSDSDPLHQRSTVDRSPKLGDRRSPRGSQSDNSLQQKKLGTRVADLESQLGQAQEELKKLKEQLASAEAAKKEAQEKLETKTKEAIVPEVTKEEKEKEEEHLLPPPPEEIHESNEKNISNPDECPKESLPETDVFEVPVEIIPAVPNIEHTTEQEESETKPADKCTDSTEPPPLSEPPLDVSSLLNAEINSLNDKLTEKEKEMTAICEENESLKKKVTEATAEAASALAKEEETALKLTRMEEELEESKANTARLSQQLEAAEGAKEALETEMKKMRVQTEQWRKAADAAAAVLAGGVEMNGRRVVERCGSMDKHLGSGLEAAGGGFAGFVGSPLMAGDLDDGFGKRKGAGIRMFGDLWKKKGQK